METKPCNLCISANAEKKRKYKMLATTLEKPLTQIVIEYLDSLVEKHLDDR